MSNSPQGKARYVPATTRVTGPAARWKPWSWRTFARGWPLEELLDLWVQTDLVDCRLEEHERPGLLLSAHNAVGSSGSGPTNAKSMVRPSNRRQLRRRHRPARAPRHRIRPPTQRRLHVPGPSPSKTSVPEKVSHPRLSFSCESSALPHKTNPIQADRLGPNDVTRPIFENRGAAATLFELSKQRRNHSACPIVLRRSPSLTCATWACAAC